MAGSAVIGSLRVNLGIDSAQFSNGVKKAQSSLGVLGASLKAFAIGAAAALSLGAITRSITSVIDKADELGKAAQKIGIPVEELSKLEFAAKLADVSLEQLSTGVGKLSKNMAAIQGGQGGDAGKALRAIGVSATDASGKLRPTSEVMADIAEKFSRMKDGAGKTALAMAIFGKSGAELIPLLNAGRDGLREAADELERFGGVISKEAAQAAEGFNDNLTRLSTAGSGFTTQITIGILPALNDLTDALVGFAKEGTLAENTITALNGILEYTRGFLLAIGGAWKEVSRWISASGEAMQALGSGDFSGAVAAFSKASAELDAMWTDIHAQIDGTAQAVNRIGKGSRETVQTDAPAFTSPGGAKKLSEALLQSQYDAKQLNMGILALSKSTDLLTESTMTLGQEMAQALGSELQGWLDAAISGTLDFKDALGGLLQTLTKLALNNALLSLMNNAVNPVQGGGLMGSIAKLLGFAKGGSFKVGGSGGIDSQLVAFKASPNERVSVNKPGQGMGGATNVQVNVNNYGNDNVDVQRRDGPDGPRFDVVIGQMIDNHIGSGRANKAMRGQFGVLPQKVRR